MGMQLDSLCASGNRSVSENDETYQHLLDKIFIVKAVNQWRDIKKIDRHSSAFRLAATIGSSREEIRRPYAANIMTDIEKLEENMS